MQSRDYVDLINRFKEATRPHSGRSILNTRTRYTTSVDTYSVMPLTQRTPLKKCSSKPIKPFQNSSPTHRFTPGSIASLTIPASITRIKPIFKSLFGESGEGERLVHDRASDAPSPEKLYQSMQIEQALQEASQSYRRSCGRLSF